MVAALIVTLVIIAAAVGWFLLASPTARTASRKNSVETTTPALAPSAPQTHRSGNERALVLAALPSDFDREVTVKSRSEKGRTYQVNLARLTCTCPDFEKRRASLPANDIRRVCKHLGRRLEEADALPHFDEVAQAFICPPKASRSHSIEHGVNGETFVELADGADALVLAFASGSAWVDVVTRRGTNDRIKKYKRYSYNVHERRWSYGSAPFSDGEIRQTIHTHFRG